MLFADKAALEKALADFQRAAQKLGEIVYKESQAAGAPPSSGPQAGGPGAGAQSGARSAGDEPVDADFEVKQ